MAQGSGYDISLAASAASSASQNNPFSASDQSLNFGSGAGRLTVGITGNQIIIGLCVALALGLLAVAIKRKLN